MQSNEFPWDSRYGSDPTPAPPEAPTDPQNARKRFSRLGMGTFVILVVSFVAMIILAVILEFVMPDWREHPWGIWLMNAIPQYLIAFPLGVLIFRTIPAKPPERTSLKPGQCFSMVAIGFFMMYAGNYIGNYVANLLNQLMGITVDNPVEDLVVGSALIPRLLFPVILAPIMEEYIFRKQLIDRMRVYGGKLAVIVSAVIFGLFHGNLSQLFYAASLGLVLGYVYQRTGKLRYSIGLHMLINFVGGYIAPLFLEHIPDIEQLDLTNPEALGALLPWVVGFVVYIFTLLGLAITGMVLLCIKARKLTFTPAEEPLPKGKRFTTVCLNAGMILLLLGCIGEIALSLLKTTS